MPNSPSSNIIAFLISLLLYCAVLLVLMSYLASQQEWIERFSSKKDDFLDIVMVNRSDSNKPKKISAKTLEPIPKQKPTLEPPGEKSETNKQTSTKPLANVKDLFRGVDSSVLAEPLDIPKPSPKTQSRLKPNEMKKVSSAEPSIVASKIVGSLEFEEISKTESTGTYDPYKGKISELLTGYWQQTIDTISGVEATVEIRIDGTGSFSYSIVALSYNNAFNVKLRDFLERMKNVQFPPYTEDGIMRMNVKFKDIME